MLGCQLLTFSLVQHHLSRGVSAPILHIEQYQCLLGYLIYLTITRQDISYSIQLLNQFTQKPRQPFLDVVMHLLLCLQSTPCQGLFFPSRNSMQITTF